MARPKGQGKTPGSGRTAGTPNKPKQKVLEIVRETGQDPLVVLSEMLSDPDIENRKWAASQLMPYCYPKLTAVQHAEDPDNPLGAARDDKYLQKLKEVIDQQAKERKRG